MRKPTRECPHCGNMYMDWADTCPQCGKPFKAEKGKTATRRRDGDKQKTDNER